jgi:vancomycin resistance protein YoaR
MSVTSIPSLRPHLPRLVRAVPQRVRLVALVILLGVGLAVLGAVAFDRAYAGRVLPGVSVAGIDVSGLTADELRARLASLPVGPDRVEIVTGSRRVTVESEELGRRIDVDGAVTEAIAAGRVSGPLADVPERLALWRDGRDISLNASVDRDALVAWVAARAADLYVTPRSAEIVATDAGWIATTPRSGRSLDRAAATDAIAAVILGGSGATARVELATATTVPDVDGPDAVLAIAEAERMTAPLTVNFRDDLTWTLPTTTLRAAVRFVAGDERPVATIDPEALAGSLSGIAKDVARGPTETILLKAKNGSTFGFVPGRNGRTVDVAATAAQIADIVEARRTGAADAETAASVILAVIPPKLTAQEAAASARQMTLVGSWTTKFHSSERNGFGANIRLPAKFINGTVVQPGQVFDFWGAVGPVTFSRGFRMGGIIESGRTNPTGAIGGGICSASTTMFNAAARAGFQILEREQHAYYISRYPLGLDATVSKYAGHIAQNMRFRNDTKNAIFIRGLSGPGFVRFEIYSLPTGRTVTFTKPAVSNVRKAVDRTYYTASLRRGTSRRDETPTNGMDVVVYRTVRDASGNVIHRDRFASHYIKVDGILMVGTG